MPIVITLSSPPQLGTEPVPAAHHLDEKSLAPPGPAQVLVRFLASPINPLDLVVMAGAYPVQPQHMHTADGLKQPILGYDGVARVVRCGGAVTQLKPGDLVIPSRFGLGTWRSAAIVAAAEVRRIPQPRDIVFAALLRLGVAPAYFLVEDTVALKAGDRIVLNAGTSVVAQFVTQFARLKGIKVVHVLRDRDASKNDLKAIKKALLQSGAEDVFSETEFMARAAGLRKTGKTLLAIDSVFGRSGEALMNALSNSGTYVQVGFLGGLDEALTIRSADLFARRLVMKGFRGSAQLADRSVEKQDRLFSDWIEQFNDGKLRLPALGIDVVRCHGDDVEAGGRALGAIERALSGTIGQRKQVLVFQEDDA